LTNAKARSWSHKTRFVANSDAVASSWWSACQYASLEHVDFALCLKPSAQVIAQARGWEMYPLQKAWEAEAVGIVDLQVAPEFRRQGLGTYFLVQILKYYRDCGATLAEAQTMTRNLAARRLFARVGFQDIDSGVVYRSQASDAAPPPLRRPPLPLQPSKPPE
jgi:RimJ/RimL family protein N-acetyltransferase